MTESTLLRAVLQALQLRRVWSWRNNSGLTVLGKGKSRRVIKGAPAGSPDVFCVIRGRLCGIELKTDKGRQLATQRRWQEKAEANGVGYGIARSIGEALALVDRWSLEASHEGGRKGERK